MYEAGGLLASLGCFYEYKKMDMVIFTDLCYKNGSFGIGDDSRKVNYGISIGAVKKFGSI